MCEPTSGCYDLGCVGATTLIRTNLNICQCECNDQTNPFRNCYNGYDNELETYTPTITIMPSPLSVEYISTTILNEVDGYGTQLMIDFGILSEFYTNGLEFFHITMSDLSSNTLQDVIKLEHYTIQYPYTTDPMEVPDTSMCFWILKDNNGDITNPSNWVDNTVHPTKNTFIKSITRAGLELFGEEELYDDILYEKLQQQNTFGIIRNSRFNIPLSTVGNQDNLRLILSCSFIPILDEYFDFSTMIVNINPFGSKLSFPSIVQWSITPHIPYILPIRSFTPIDENFEQVQIEYEYDELLNPTTPSLSIMFHFHLSLSPHQYDSLTFDFPSLDSASPTMIKCRFVQNQSGLISYGYTIDTTNSQFIWISVTHYTEDLPGVVNCVLFLQGDVDVVINAEGLLDYAINSNFYIAIPSITRRLHNPQFTLAKTEITSLTLKSQGNTITYISYGTHLSFIIDPIQYPSLFERVPYDFTPQTDIIARLQYPTECSYPPIILGPAIVSGLGRIQVQVTTKDLKPCATGHKFTFHFDFLNTPRDDNLTEVQIFNVHVGLIITVQYCFNILTNPNSFWFDQKQDKCPANGNAECAHNSGTCECVGGGTNCLCSGQMKWDGYDCIPTNCPDGESWNGSMCIIPNCNSAHFWDPETRTCESGCESSDEEVINDVCVPKCTIDEERINNVCVPKCTIDEERINGNCVPKCLVTEERINNICVVKCDIQTHERINNECKLKCTIEQERINNECVIKCTENEQRNDNGQCISTTPPDNNTCTLNCKNDSTPNTECTECNCSTTSLFIGTECNICGLQCFNEGITNILCQNCICSKRGYSGKQCECRDIGFIIRFQSVPKQILDDFENDPINTGSAPTALQYIRTQLLSQSFVNDNELSSSFQTLTITSLSLINGSLSINGSIRDNCNTVVTTNNYNQLQLKWVEFLQSLKQVGLKLDDGEIIPVESTEVTYPDIKCDSLYDTDCDGILSINSTFNINSFSSTTMIISTLVFSQIVLFLFSL